MSILSIMIEVGNSDGIDEHFGINFLWKPLRWLRHWISKRWHNTEFRSWSGYFTQGIGETLDHASFSVYWSPSCKNPALTGHCLLQLTHITNTNSNAQIIDDHIANTNTNTHIQYHWKYKNHCLEENEGEYSCAVCVKLLANTGFMISNRWSSNC